MPVAGEIVFHLGDSSPMMTWCYQEPRALTHMTVLPLPFSVTSNTPIKVHPLVLICFIQFALALHLSMTISYTFYC